MTDKTPTSPSSALPQEVKPKPLLAVLDVWEQRVKLLGLKRGSSKYNGLHCEFFCGAEAAMNAMSDTLGPAVAIYVMTGRDLLDLKEKIDA